MTLSHIINSIDNSIVQKIEMYAVFHLILLIFLQMCPIENWRAENTNLTKSIELKKYNFF